MAICSPAVRLLPALRRSALAADRTDGALVAEFARTRDPDLFSVLVARHGGMVFGVCRRVVGDRHAAEDAFQAVWLVLARRAGHVRPPGQVANWLYGVAYRTALRARATLMRRRTRERPVDEVPHPVAPSVADPWADLLPVLDAELARLPDKLRLPLVLCDLEGRPQRAAAAELGVPVATLTTRLATARRTLAARLTARGVTLSAGAMAAALGANAQAVPPALVAAAVSAAAGAVPAAVARLTEEVSRMMLVAKLKQVTAGAVVALAVAGFGVQTVAATADPPAPALGPALSDAEFLKRVCLDLRGSPATQVELGYFVADQDKAKRRKVVGWLTEPEAAKVSADELGRRPALKPLPEYVVEPPDVLSLNVSANGPETLVLLQGEYMIRPDGTVGLGRYGSVKVAGLTQSAAIRAIANYVAGVVTPTVPVKSLSYTGGVSAFNSKRYYVISDYNGQESVRAFPMAGSETVLDVLAQTSGLIVPPRANVWVSRHSPWAGQPEQVLPVDWAGITQHGATATNYQLQAGDRVYVRTRSVADDLTTAEYQRWRALDIDPWGTTDGAFLRRLCLDLYGTLPTRIEREYFLADPDPKKREKLLDLFLRDPAVAKKVGPDWKRLMLADGDLRFHVTYEPAPHPLAGLVGQLVAAKRPADQVLDTLTAAVLGRLPTDAERAVILAQVTKKPDPSAAWQEVVDALSRTPEARAHAERLKARAGPAGEKK